VVRVRLANTKKTLVIRGVVGKANVHYMKGQGITTSTKGSHILGIFLNGNRVNLGRNNALRIRGLVNLKSHVVKKTKSSIQITELRLTLLGGANAGATVDLGHAQIGIKKSGL
jgi:hypothetical protein